VTDSLLTSVQVAELLAVSTKTLANWRYKGKIPYFKLNGLVRYRLEEIHAWLEDGQISTLEDS